MGPFSLSLFFMLGVSVGTFLTTCIERLPFEEEEGLFDEEEPAEWYYHIPMLGLFFAMPLYTRFKALLPASRCPSCGHRLRFFERLPLLSFIVQNGRCLACGFKIPGRHPVVELTTGLLFVLFAHRFSWSLELAVSLLFVSLFMIATVVDFRFQIIPDEVNLAGLLAGIFLSLARTCFWVFDDFVRLKTKGIPLAWSEFESSVLIKSGSIGWSLTGFLAGAGALMLLYYVGTAIARTDAMGGGDIKLAGFIGLFIGAKGVLVALFWSTIIGAVFGLFILLAGMGIREGGFTKFAFGPYICAGTLLTVYFGTDAMIDAYFHFNGWILSLFLDTSGGFDDTLL